MLKKQNHLISKEEKQLQKFPTLKKEKRNELMLIYGVLQYNKYFQICSAFEGRMYIREVTFFTFNLLTNVWKRSNFYTSQAKV